MRPVFLALILSVALAPCAAAAEHRHFEDAALNAVQFWDRNEGWAVGDAGTIWHTIDGGKNWERQTTLVRASLRGLQFLTPYVGWAVGREELPDGGSVGTILFTRDGGFKWQIARGNTMPGLSRICFVDARTGFVIGDGTDQFPTGVFVTHDSGRTWQPVPGPRCPGWLAGSFSNDKTGALVGRWNRLAALTDGALGAADVDSLGGRSMRGLYVDGKQTLAVGQGGLILRSETGGVHWGVVDTRLAPEVRASWDFHAVHGRGDHVWVAGRPGSALLHSSDRGKSWEIQKTDQQLPLNDLCFVDEANGWAVGEFGTILATADGGKTWKAQRRGGLQAAVLFVHARASELPVDTIAYLGAQEGYLAAATRVTAADPGSADPARASEPQRWQEAMSAAGGAAGETLWQFPLPAHLNGADRVTLMTNWDRLHGGHAAEQMVRQLVLALRTWKPAIVVTDHPDPAATGHPTDSLVAEALNVAFARAADPKAFPEQVQTLGLEPWQAVKLYSLWNSHSGSQVVLDTSDVSRKLEETFRDFATPSALLLTQRVPPLPRLRYYHLLESKLEGAASHKGLMDGTALGCGGTCRRALEEEGREPDEARLKAAARRRTLEALAEAQPGAGVDPEKLLAQLAPTFATLSDEQAGAAAFGIATQYARQGQWTLAREVFLLMVDHYPAHDRTPDAYRWLVRYNSSSEAKRRHELGHFLLVSNLTFQTSGKKPRLDVPSAKIEAQGLGQDVARSGLVGPLRDLKETRAWYEGGLKIGERLAACGPLYATDPSLHFCLNSAQRNLGNIDEACAWYASFRDTHGPGPWREAAAAETWLRTRTGACPKALAPCRMTSLRPMLDARFDDACWQGQKPFALKNAAGETLKEFATEVMLSFDDQFLYVALNCRHPADRYVAPVAARKRDEDVRAFDRVSLLLDLDRDYSTYYRLEVDQRGCVCEDCWGDRTWNPRWFVAARSDKNGWRAELAIPLTELTGDRVSVGRAWACNVVRVVPGRGVQALSLPADVEPRPEGMGILMFTPEQQLRMQARSAD